MVPAGFHDFFSASAGAGAALVGLLFVAVSIAPERTVMRYAPIERQATAASAFTALVNAFFISLIALLPGPNLGGAAVLMSTLALIQNLSLGWSLLRQRQEWRVTLRAAFLVLAGFAIYGLELYQGVRLLANQAAVGYVYTLATLLIGVYGLGLTRAWQLLGARRFGLVGWLSLLRDGPESPAAVTTLEEQPHDR
jgi:hypothetical protein